MTLPRDLTGLFRSAKGKASRIAYLVQSPFWTRKNPGFFTVKHGQLFLEPKEGWRAYLRAHDEWEPIVREKLYSTIRPGDVVLDLGSNYGEFALQMADLVGEKGRVIGMEMDPHYVTILQLNKEYNLSLKERFTILHAPLSTKNNLEWISTQTKTVPTFYFSDIEGAEQLLVEQLFSNPKWLKHSPRFLLELHPEIYGEKTAQTIIEKFKSAGYDAEAVDYKHYYFARPPQHVKGEQP